MIVCRVLAGTPRLLTSAGHLHRSRCCPSAGLKPAGAAAATHQQNQRQDAPALPAPAARPAAQGASRSQKSFCTGASG